MSVRTPFSYQGSKLKELNKLSEFIPKGSKIIEPFLGTGIVSQHFGRDNSCLGNDYNIEIYYIWKYAKEQNAEFISYCKDLMQEDNRNEVFYYKHREEYNALWKTKSEYNSYRSALFYYLINSCHAGMTRYGPNGFNTSYKLYLNGDTLYNVNEKLGLLLNFSNKFVNFESKDAKNFLLDNENIIKNFDVIYCDPPYTNSAAPYISSWDDNKLLELDDILVYLNKKHDIYSVMSNFALSDDTKLKGNISKEFSTYRQAGTKVVKKQDIIITYGEIPKFGLERFL